MKDSRFYDQAELLLRILPIINREDVFALKGGTAINFFVRDIPRLSVDIDLVYLPVEERDESLSKISGSLIRIEESVLKLIKDTRSTRKIIEGKITGLIISTEKASIKIETNTIIRGSVLEVQEYSLCEKGKEVFELNLRTRSLCFEELYAGKICAALDRQHPRDLYDIKLLLDNEGITEKTRKTFLIYLISHNRPILELLNPNFADIAEVYEKEFAGMTREEIPVEKLLTAREEFVTLLQKNLTADEKEFLVSFKSIDPNWKLLGLDGIENLPAVKWKLMNLKQMNKIKHSEALENLREFLYKL